jgi:hypothetical protein
MLRNSLPRLLSGLFLALGLYLIWRVQADAWIPARAGGWLRADGLNALMISGLGALALTDPHRSWLRLAGLGLLVGALLSLHLGLTAMLLVASAVVLSRGSAGWQATIGLLPAAGGLFLIGSAGSWDYLDPIAGAGLNSVAFGLILIGALAAGGAWRGIVSGSPPPLDPLVALAGLYPLYRLFGIGAWNLGWLYAAMLGGAALAFWAAQNAWRSTASARHDQLTLVAVGVAIAGAGMGSSAGVALGGLAGLTMIVQRLGLSDPEPHAWTLWAVSGAVPLSLPFISGWAALAAALSGRLSVLALALWAAIMISLGAILRDVPPVVSAPSRRAVLVSGLSMIGGIASPLILVWAIVPAVSQLQRGLTPFGDLELWPWAGLIALDATGRPVATAPSLALLGLMLAISAIAWIGLRLVRPVRD